MRALLALVVLFSVLSAGAQQPKRADRAPGIIASIDARAAHYSDVAHQIWGFAEVGYQEVKSSALLQRELTAAGFAVKPGIDGMPTAFTAEFGRGKPVIAVLGEFDALPGLSQDTIPEPHPLAAGAPGHGCGHHLFGTASAAAAIAVKEWMVANQVAGTLRFYGTPAEEGGAGKVYMVRDGLFDDVDVAIAWHPDDRNNVTATSSLANISGKFRFRGVSAHAAASPELGRSALDAVEVMDVMTNFMREHIPSDARIHYVITNGGRAPNVVPDFAEVYYVVRHPDIRVVDQIWARVLDAAKGAALGTGTTHEVVVTGAVYNLLINKTLAKVQQQSLERVGGYSYSADERAWAERLQQTLPGSAVPLEAVQRIQPLDFTPAAFAGSTDVGDVSWRVPTVQMGAATWVPGTPAHSWQAVAAGGMSIGSKGMMVAAKTMALTAAELFSSPATVTAARAEFEQARGPNFRYATRLGTQKPALDYRK
ncbi:MAG TPA: amidohydrolase [Gemmatimonadaceae bacterium]|jgi:aminobenzoyl-glutamate utilization protein B